MSRHAISIGRRQDGCAFPIRVRAFRSHWLANPNRRQHTSVAAAMVAASVTGVGRQVAEMKLSKGWRGPG
jgi:hypothetical protein